MEMRMQVWFRLSLFASLALCCSCMSKPPEGRLRCADDRDCPNGWHCHDDLRCYTSPQPAAADGGPDTSSEREAGTPTSPNELMDASGMGMPMDAATKPPTPRAGSGGAGGAGGRAGAAADAGVDAGSPEPPDAGTPPVPMQTVALGASGCDLPNTICDRAAACVGDRCLITMCEAAGTYCDGPAECCDLACNSGLCKCGNHSASCSTATTPCCDGLYCETGQCATCKAQGATCAGAYQCCGTTDCYEGTCQCRPMGATCDSQSVCCAGTRCDGGVCTCRAEGATCDDNSVCCSGLRCTNGMCAVPTGVIFNPGIFVPPGTIWRFECKLADIGEACATTSDCCSQNCFDGKCVASCRGLGEEADVDNQCCSRLRAEGKCAYAGCNATGQTCTAHPNCCSGKCQNAQCAP
jgi:hypothetical protein